MSLFNGVDFKGKVVVITGAGGVICSCLAKAVAKCKGKVALLDLHQESAQVYADEIIQDYLGLGTDYLDYILHY